jgi:hypothetical protein
VPVASGTSEEIERQPLSESRPSDFEEGVAAG